MQNPRPLKFRIWDLLSKSWVNYSEYSYLKRDELSNNPAIFSLEYKTVIYQQFTGLLDKSGREIYEGDIVKSSGCLTEDLGNFIIQWNKNDCGFRLFSIHKDENWNHCSADSDNLEAMSIEIIGNIHENPDLLNQTT